MSNGGVIEELKAVMESGEIPQRVTNRLVMAGQVELYNKLKDLDGIPNRVDKLEAAETGWKVVTVLVTMGYTIVAWWTGSK